MKSKVVRSLFDKWGRCGVTYCNWKSIDHLEGSFLGVNDLDILVARADSVIAEDVLKKIGFIEFETCKLRSYPAVKDFVCYDPSIDSFIHCHLHYNLMLGDRWVKAFRLPVEELTLSTRIFLPDFQTFAVNPTVELIFLICRAPLKYQHPLKRIKVVEELNFILSRALNDNFDVGIFDNLVPSSALELCVELLNRKLSVETIPSKKISRIRNEMVEYRTLSIFKFQLKTAIRFFWRSYTEINRRYLGNYGFGRRRLRTGGLSIAFVGIDGSGKSSAIDRNAKFFARQMNVSKAFIGSGKSGASIHRAVLFKIKDVVNRFSRRKTISGLTTSSNDLSVSRAQSPAKLSSQLFRLLALIDSKYNLIVGWRRASRGNLVFNDRWPQNEIQNFLDGPRVYSSYRWYHFQGWIKSLEIDLFHRSLRFKPDLIIRIRIKPETSLLRKPDELTLEQAVTATQKINALNWGFNQIVEIDGDQDILTVDRLIRQAIWAQLTFPRSN